MGLLSKIWNKQQLLDRIEEKRARITELTDQLRQIPTGRMLMQTFDEKDIWVFFRSDLDCLGKYKPSKFVHLSTRCPEEIQVLVLAHEIRHAWQDHEGIALLRRTNVRDTLIKNRFLEADAFAIEAQIAWELTSNGVDRKAWFVYKKRNKEIAEAFETSARTEKGAFNGKALKAAFDAWFSTYHRASYDSESIRETRFQLDRVQEGRRATVETDKKREAGEPERMSADYLREFGRVANGVNYLEEADTLGEEYTKIKGGLLRRVERMERNYPLATVRVK